MCGDERSVAMQTVRFMGTFYLLVQVAVPFVDDTGTERRQSVPVANKKIKKEEMASPAGFEPARAEHTELAVLPLNHSGKATK